MKDYVDRAQEQWRDVNPDLVTDTAALAGRIQRVAQHLQVSTDAVLLRHGISRAEFDLLSLLHRTGRPMSPSELAADLMTSGAGTTKRIRKLVAAGLALREANPLDGRGALVRMSEGAPDFLLPILAAVAAHEAQVMSSLPDQDRELLAGHLRVLLIAFEIDAVAGEGPAPLS